MIQKLKAPDASAAPATCAPAVASALSDWRNQGYPGASEVTRRLLGWWFDTDHELDGSPFKFYRAQREAIESLIYVHEKLKKRNHQDLLHAFLPNTEVRLLQYGDFARYAVKMATGSGKTMVMALAIAWSYLNAVQEDGADTSGYATSFLVIAPNVIVFERLKSDFEGGRVFNRYPLVPPEYADLWGEVRFFLRGDKADIASRGAVYVTNIQQLYVFPPAVKGKKKAGPPGPIANLLGPVASDSPDQRDDFDERIIRRGAPCMIINDEAHHTHDEDSEWNRSIRGLRQGLGSERFMAQLDFTATPRFSDGALFPWVVYDYPLKAAMQDNIVKRPIKGELKGIGEVASDDASTRYEAYIEAAVNRWREYRDQLAPLGKRPVLFVMMERAKDAEKVAQKLRSMRPDDFSGDKVQEIHVGRDGEVSDKDLQQARRVVREIDTDASSINAVVSVMMLREGWDVRNVTVVLGLRPYSSKANILPEQAIGRGLRLMFPDDGGPERGYDERVDVIGTEKFMEFISNLEQEEGVVLCSDDLGTPISIVTVHPLPDRPEMDISIPNITPVYGRTSDSRDEIARLDVAAIQVNNLPFSLEPQDSGVFEYLGLDALTDETLIERQYRLRVPSTCNEVISHYADRIGVETRLPAHFNVIADKLREFFSVRAFGRQVDLEDNAIAPILARPAVGFLTVKGFVETLRPMLRIERDPAIGGLEYLLSNTGPFPWSRPTCAASRTVFNLVAADNDFEAEFARFLENAPDVARFAKLPRRLGFKIQYLANTSNLRNYYPDFIAVGAQGIHYLIETKGLEDPQVPFKDRAAQLWCKNATALTGVHWKYVKVAQVAFAQLGGKSLNDVVQAFSYQ